MVPGGGLPPDPFATRSQIPSNPAPSDAGDTMTIGGGGGLQLWNQSPPPSPMGMMAPPTISQQQLRQLTESLGNLRF